MLHSVQQPTQWIVYVGQRYSVQIECGQAQDMTRGMNEPVQQRGEQMDHEMTCIKLQVWVDLPFKSPGFVQQSRKKVEQ